MSVAAAFVVATSLSACWLWAVTRLVGTVVPVVDLLIIAALCSGLALLPSVGWVLATMIMALLIIRATEADDWAEAAVMIIGSNVIWLVVKATLLGGM